MKFEELLGQIQMCMSITSTPIVDRFPVEPFSIRATLMKEYIRQVEHLIKYNGYSKDIQILDTLNKMKIMQEVYELLNMNVVTSDVAHALNTEVDWEKLKHLYTIEMDKLSMQKILLNQFDNFEELNTLGTYLCVTSKGMKVGRGMFNVKGEAVENDPVIIELLDKGIFIKRDFERLRDFLQKSQMELNRVTARKFLSRCATYDKLLKDQADSTVVLLNAPILEKDSVKYVEFNGKDVHLSKTRYSNIYRGVFDEFSGTYKVFLDCTKEATT